MCVSELRREQRLGADPDGRSEMVRESSTELSFAEPDIAVLTLDMPGKGANILSRAVLDELDERLNDLSKRADLAGLVIISAKPGIFVAGADLREFAASLDVTPEQAEQTCRRGQVLFQRLSQTPYVTVAAIDGVCVGGGAELAVWCDRRIVTRNPATVIGFPEVKLGLFPGWGGTARTPRMIGMANAVEMVTGGESVSVPELHKLGLVEDVVATEDLLPAAIRMIRSEAESASYLADRRRWSQPVNMSDTELGFLGATASAMIQQQTKGHYPAPAAALEVMLEAAGADIDEACRLEAKGMSTLFGSPTNASLLNVFFLTDRNKKDRGVEDDALEPQKIKTAAVIGAGIMGAGIAAANVKRKLHLTLSDASRDALGRGVSQVLEEVAFNKATRSADVQRTIEYAPFLNATESDAELATADLVIEAVVENADIKRQIFQRLEPQLPEHAILASNTSTIPITRLAEGLSRPQQFCGIHFFNPVRKMKLVEVIRGAETSDQTVATAVAYAKKLGKSPIVVNDGPGFLVNRLLLPYMNEALELIADGVEIKHIEKVAKSFGMPMGPIMLYDIVGLDTAHFAGQTMHDAFPNRVKASPILPALLEAGRLGQKSGKGFYSFENPKRRAVPDPELATHIAPFVKQSKGLDPQQIEDRLFLPMVLEATRILQDNIVRDARDVDLGVIFGIGFPPFKGGLLFWADTIGAAGIIERLKPFAELGERMQPTELLEEMAADGRSFYAAHN